MSRRCDECGSEPVAFNPCTDCENSKELVALRTELAATKADLKTTRYTIRVMEQILAATKVEASRLRESMGRIAIGSTTHEEFPDYPMMWPERFDCVRCGAYGESVDHLDKRHKEDCPVRIARAAMLSEGRDK